MSGHERVGESISIVNNPIEIFPQAEPRSRTKAHARWERRCKRWWELKSRGKVPEDWFRSAYGRDTFYICGDLEHVLVGISNEQMEAALTYPTIIPLLAAVRNRKLTSKQIALAFAHPSIRQGFAQRDPLQELWITSEIIEPQMRRGVSAEEIVQAEELALQLISSVQKVRQPSKS